MIAKTFAPFPGVKPFAIMAAGLEHAGAREELRLAGPE
jgi:hypothetical protein